MTIGQTDFDQTTLCKTTISVALIALMNEAPPPATINVIIDANLGYIEGRQTARERIEEMVLEIIAKSPHRTKKMSRESLAVRKNAANQQYIFARLRPDSIRLLVQLDAEKDRKDLRAIYKIWFDHPVKQLIDASICTIKVDAARNSFAALGEGIVWAVIDSGIDGTHPHFSDGVLDPPRPLFHRDFSGVDIPEAPDGHDMSALRDEFGHGTHVAGIIAGDIPSKGGKQADKPRVPIWKTAAVREGAGDPTMRTTTGMARISGMAPRAKLLSLKVFARDEEGNSYGSVSNVIAALSHIAELNSYGRHIQVHGVNLSVGYDFDPLWFACGHSPVCVEVNRLVRSGVVVVIAAGNSGYGRNTVAADGAPTSAGFGMSINDPGNAESAITVGSTHRDSPYQYGISYFSSKGPTADGRMKPDLVAPGERIISCQSAQWPAAPHDSANPPPKGAALYTEMSGTSMAAPHVSGAIAAFLSIRREFIGQPERVKQIFLAGATSLGRDQTFQGHGMLDLMRSIQSV